MSGLDRRTSLLVFTLGASCESRRRQLLPAGWSTVEERLHRACLDAALDAGRIAGCRVVVSSPQRLDLPAGVEQCPQSGRGFGPRLREAWNEAFASSGGGPLVVVGSDVPGIRPAHVRRTLDLLQENPERVVVGPSPDGGFYLLASSAPLDDVLASVHWCCRDTLKSLRRALARRGREVVLLAPLADLDHRVDLEHWLSALVPAELSASWRRLLSLLHRLLATLRRAHWSVLERRPPRRSAVRMPPLRAPPAVV